MVKRDKQNTLKNDKRPRARSVMKKKTIVLIVGGIIVAAAVSYGVWFYLKDSTKPSSEVDKPLTKSETLHNELINSVIVGSQSDSDATLKRAVDAAENDEQRAELYLQRASYLFYADDVTVEAKEQALLDAEKSYELHKSGAATKTMLDIATDLNRQDLVAKYQPIFDEYVKDIKDPRQEEGQ